MISQILINLQKRISFITLGDFKVSPDDFGQFSAEKKFGSIRYRHQILLLINIKQLFNYYFPLKNYF